MNSTMVLDKAALAYADYNDGFPPTIIQGGTKEIFTKVQGILRNPKMIQLFSVELEYLPTFVKLHIIKSYHLIFLDGFF